MNTKRFCEDLMDWPDDKQTVGNFLKDGCYCAIGWLLHKGGVSDDALIEASEEGDENIQLAADQILAKYDLTYSDVNPTVNEIFRTNDDVMKGGTPKQRVLSQFCGV